MIKFNIIIEVKEKVMEKKKRYPHKCPFCDYEWLGIKEIVLECPMCKQYLKRLEFLRKGKKKIGDI